MDCKFLVDRVNLIIKTKNITARQFAESIGIQPSGMSHIMSGRNNPSLEFVMKVVERYPDISLSWLLQGKGEMTAVPKIETPTPRIETKVEPMDLDLFSSVGIEAEPQVATVVPQTVAVASEEMRQPEISALAVPASTVAAVGGQPQSHIPPLPRVSAAAPLEMPVVEESPKIEPRPIAEATAMPTTSEPLPSHATVDQEADTNAKGRRLRKVLLFYSDGSIEEWGNA